MSTNAWNEGYFTAVDYIHGYYNHLNPNLQRFFMLAAGYAPLEPQAGSAHCELGFGQGTSINAHAIAQPHLFVGTDFTPSQAAFARHIASVAGVDARLYDDSFEQLLSRTDLPQFDSISLHGIWTWVSQENRNFIIEFARRHLKPGGVFCVSYNSQPGWSSKTPIRQLLRMRDVFAQHFSDLPEGMNTHAQQSKNLHERRIGQSLDLAAAVVDQSTAWVSRNPNAVRYFQSLVTKNRVYLAHEYFNSSWDCMFFADVAQQLEVAKLNFVCSADPVYEVRGMEDPDTLARARVFLQDIANPVLREQVKDFWRFDTFRIDLFQRGSRQLTEVEQHIQLFENTHFIAGTPLPYAINAMQQWFKDAPSVDERIWRPMLEYFAGGKRGPKSLRPFVTRLEKEEKKPLSEQIRILAILVAQGHIAPCQSDEAVAQVRERCQRFNRWALERFLVDESVIALVSPYTGGYVHAVNGLDKLLMLAWCQGHQNLTALTDRSLQLLAAKNYYLKDDAGQPIREPALVRAVMQKNARDWQTNKLPVYQSLQMF